MNYFPGIQPQQGYFGNAYYPAMPTARGAGLALPGFGNNPVNQQQPDGGSANLLQNLMAVALVAVFAKLLKNDDAPVAAGTTGTAEKSASSTQTQLSSSKLTDQSAAEINANSGISTQSLKNTLGSLRIIQANLDPNSEQYKSIDERAAKIEDLIRDRKDEAPPTSSNPEHAAVIKSLMVLLSNLAPESPQAIAIQNRIAAIQALD